MRNRFPIREQCRTIPNKPLSANSFLPGATRAGLSERLRAQAQVLAEYQSRLPDELARHLVAVVDGPRGRVLFADAPAWVTRLRFALPHADRARVRVLPPDPVRRKPPARARPVPASARASLEGVAASITDAPLRAALERLARRAGKG